MFITNTYLASSVQDNKPNLLFYIKLELFLSSNLKVLTACWIFQGALTTTWSLWTCGPWASTGPEPRGCWSWHQSLPIRTPAPGTRALWLLVASGWVRQSWTITLGKQGPKVFQNSNCRIYCCENVCVYIFILKFDSSFNTVLHLKHIQSPIKPQAVSRSWLIKDVCVF